MKRAGLGPVSAESTRLAPPVCPPHHKRQDNRDKPGNTVLQSVVTRLKGIGSMEMYGGDTLIPGVVMFLTGEK